MAPSNTTQRTHHETSQTTKDAAYAEGHLKLKDWTTRFYKELNDSEGYAKVHKTFFREFEKLSDQVRGSGKRSIVPYIAPVFNHTASQGYQPDIHYDPLFQGMSAFCQNLPPPAWVAPPDQFDKSPTPTLQPLPPLPPSAPKMPNAIAKPPTRRTQPVPAPSPPPVAPSNKSKGKADKTTSKEKPAKEPAPSRTKPPAKDKVAPKSTKPKKSNEYVEDETTDGERRDVAASDGEGRVEESKPKDKEAVKCVSCEKDGNPCLVNPSTIDNASPACYECFTAKRKCSLCKRGGRKKKPVAVPPGGVGELSCKSSPWNFLSEPNALLATFGVPKDMADRFDRYETEVNTNREELKELAQKVAALTAENHTLRHFCSDRLFNMYEALSTRDVETTEALRTILTIQHEEHRLNQRHLEATNRLEVLLRQPLSTALNQADALLGPLPPLPVSPSSQSENRSNAAGTAGTKSGEFAADVPASIQTSNKRGTSSRPEDIDNTAKRQKL